MDGKEPHGLPSSSLERVSRSLIGYLNQLASVWPSSWIGLRKLDTSVRSSGALPMPSSPRTQPVTGLPAGRLPAQRARES
jgi:hypothetical protein